MKKPVKHKSVSPKAVDLGALVQGGDTLAYTPPLECATTSIYEHQRSLIRSDGIGSDGSGVLPGVELGQEAGQAEGGQGAGGRSGESFATPRETAKPLSLISPSPDENPDVNPQSDMPVLGDLRGVHRKEDPKVVESCHVGGIHSKNSPVLGHKGSDLVTTSLNIPYSPDVPEPSSTEETVVASPFITGNGRIDRRTAFTQYCRLGEGRTYIKVAEIMGLPLGTIKDWAKEDNWENAYRERVTADIVQVAKEENIHEVLDIRREVIAQLKAKIQDSKEGKEVFKSTKEMLDTMLKLEELTGASTANAVKPGQIFVIISQEEWEAREKMNESARLEEAKA